MLLARNQAFYANARLFPLRLKSSKAADHRFTITYKIPNSHTPAETETFSSVKAFQTCFKGDWRFTNTKTGITHSLGEFKTLDVDPTTIYHARHPAVIEWEEISYDQHAEKTFREKSGKAVEESIRVNLRVDIRRRTAQDPTSRDGWRFLTEQQDVVEWEGIWEGPGGHVFFLEVKHFMNATGLSNVNAKLIRSLTFLGIARSQASVYVAGKHWNDEVTVNAALSLGFGVVQDNGRELDVKAPNLVLKRGKDGLVENEGAS